MSALSRYLRRLRASYARSLAESVTRFAASRQLLSDAAKAMDAARTVQTDRPPWCATCGERLAGAGEVHSHGMPPRCHGR